MSIRTRLTLTLAVLVAVLATGCEVALNISINVNDDGGGIVVVQAILDNDAVQAAPPNLSNQLRTGDLIRAGWEVSGPTDNGVGEVYTASKSFDHPDQIQDLLDEITGPRGMFQNFVLSQDPKFAESTVTLTGELDLTPGVEMFNDPAITERFQGNPLGQPVSELLGNGQTLDDAIPVEVAITLPGEATETALSEAVYRPQWSDDEPTPVFMSSQTENLWAKVLRWVGLAAGVLFALSTILALFSFLMDRRTGPVDEDYLSPDPLPPRVPVAAGSRSMAAAGGRSSQTTAAPVASSRPRRGAGPELRCVVVEPLGTLYEISDDPAEMMADFVQEKSGSTDRKLVTSKYRDATAGHISASDFWRAVSVDSDDHETLDREWISRFRPRTGAAEFLREMRNRSLPVMILTNDSARWSRMLRDRDNLVSLSPWLISSEIGARKPDPTVYEALRKENQIPYDRWLYIDTDVDDLDAGRTLGMQTAYLVSRRPRPPQRPNHPIINSFGDFFRQ